MVTCPQCGGSHPKWECGASKAKIAAYQASLKPKVIEGTKLVAVLPPETKTTTFRGQMIVAGPNQPPAVVTPQGLEPIKVPKKKLGRPTTGFDKAAYNREYMRQKRAKGKSDGA